MANTANALRIFWASLCAAALSGWAQAQAPAENLSWHGLCKNPVWTVKALMSSDGAVQQIAIASTRTGQDIQFLPAIDAPIGQCAFIDANFDGLLDLAIPLNNGGAGPNATTHFYLFDKTSRKFIFHRPLSALSQVFIDAQRKEVHSATRNSCCSHSSETYQWRFGKLQRIADWDQSLTADGKWVVTTTGKLRNGRLRHTTHREKYHVQPSP